MLKVMLACCKLYVSESRNKAAIEAIERAAKQFPGSQIINKFEDEIYNRVGFTLVSRMDSKPTASCPLKRAVFAMVEAAFETIDFGLHSGSHPRLGVVDHIGLHPLVNASLEQVAGAAKSMATEFGSILKVPTYLYGAADREGRSLDAIRRDLGYFRPNSSGNQWVGGLKSSVLPLKPDEGPPSAVGAKGVVVIGATRWVANYNVPVFSNDVVAVRRIAKRVSARGGGLPSVQTMALAHGDGVIEVACNLLEPSKIGGSHVQLEVERLAQEEKLDVGKGYYTDISQDEIAESFLKICKSLD